MASHSHRAEPTLTTVSQRLLLGAWLILLLGKLNVFTSQDRISIAYVCQSVGRDPLHPNEFVQCGNSSWHRPTRFLRLTSCLFSEFPCLVSKNVMIKLHKTVSQSPAFANTNCLKLDDGKNEGGGVTREWRKLHRGKVHNLLAFSSTSVSGAITSNMAS